MSGVKARFEDKICPRCGAKFSYIERRRTAHNVYLYAVHVSFQGRKRKVRKCYLGAEIMYKYVERTHSDLAPRFRGMHDKNRVLDYLRAISEYLVNHNDDYDLEDLKNIRTRLEELLYVLDMTISEIEYRNEHE